MSVLCLKRQFEINFLFIKLYKKQYHSQLRCCAEYQHSCDYRIMLIFSTTALLLFFGGGGPHKNSNHSSQWRNVNQRRIFNSIIIYAFIFGFRWTFILNNDLCFLHMVYRYQHFIYAEIRTVCFMGNMLVYGQQISINSSF